MPTYVLSKVKRTSPSQKVGDLVDQELPGTELTSIADDDSVPIADKSASSAWKRFKPSVFAAYVGEQLANVLVPGLPTGTEAARAGKAIRYNANGSAPEFYVPGAQRGPEWARISLPSGATFATEILNITSAPTKQTAAPSQMTTHSGSAGNIRIKPNWAPDDGFLGWWLVPYVGSTQHRGGVVFQPRGNEGPFEYRFINFNNTGTPGTMYGCVVAFRWNTTGKYREIFVRRWSSTIGLPANASIRIYPALNG